MQYELCMYINVLTSFAYLFAMCPNFFVIPSIAVCNIHRKIYVNIYTGLCFLISVYTLVNRWYCNVEHN